MRFSVLLLAVVVATAALSAAEPSVAGECSSGSGDVLKLSEWSAIAKNERSTDVTFTLENVSKRPVQMVDGTVWFVDALGQSIGGIKMEPDVVLQPGKKAQQSASMAGFQRLVKARKQDISAYSCVRSVLYEDGSKEEFK